MFIPGTKDPDQKLRNRNQIRKMLRNDKRITTISELGRRFNISGSNASKYLTEGDKNILRSRRNGKHPFKKKV